MKRMKNCQGVTVEWQPQMESDYYGDGEWGEHDAAEPDFHTKKAKWVGPEDLYLYPCCKALERNSLRYNLSRHYPTERMFQNFPALTYGR